MPNQYRSCSCSGVRPAAGLCAHLPVRFRHRVAGRQSRRAPRIVASLPVGDLYAALSDGSLQLTADSLAQNLYSLSDLDLGNSPDVHAAAEGLVQQMFDMADAAIVVDDAPPAVRDDGWLAPISNTLQNTLGRIRVELESLGVKQSAGWSIICLVAFVKLVTYPLTKKQVESAMATQNLGPMIKAIKARYGEDKQRIQAETSRVYTEAGVNPLAGCLPTLVQLPVFWGLYRALQNASVDNEFSQPFLFIPDLSGPVEFGSKAGTSWLLPFVDGAPPIGWEAATPYIALPALIVVSQFISTEILQLGQPEPEEEQKTTLLVLKFLPLMLGWFALNVPAGLGVYWLSNTVLTSAVQVYLRFGGGANPVVGKMMEAPKVTLGTAIRSTPYISPEAAALQAPSLVNGTTSAGMETNAVSTTVSDAPSSQAVRAPSAQPAAPVDAVDSMQFADDLPVPGFAGDMPSPDFAARAPKDLNNRVAQEQAPALPADAVADVMEKKDAGVEINAPPAVPAPMLQPLMMADLSASIGVAAGHQRQMRALTARRCKRSRNPQERLTSVPLSPSLDEGCKTVDFNNKDEAQANGLYSA